ncbi:VOC family protein [Streptomyces sp. NPDC003710]
MTWCHGRSSAQRTAFRTTCTRIDIGQGDVDWVVMADPDGHEFCVLTPR